MPTVTGVGTSIEPSPTAIDTSSGPGTMRVPNEVAAA